MGVRPAAGVGALGRARASSGACASGGGGGGEQGAGRPGCAAAAAAAGAVRAGAERGGRAGGEEATGAGAPRCALAGGTWSRLRRRAGTRAQPRRLGLRVPLLLPAAKMDGEVGGVGPQWRGG